MMSVSDPASTLQQTRSRLISRQLPTFAAVWLANAFLWLIVFAIESRPMLPAGAFFVSHLALLALAIGLCRANAEAPRVRTVTVAACVLLGLSSLVACTTMGVPGEVLAFMLLALYLMTALFFSWGWVPELIVLAGTAIPWALSIGKLDFSWPPLELAAAIGIGSVLSLAIAERSARSVCAAFHDDERVREANRSLTTTLEAYRNLAEGAREFIWAADLTGRFTYMNEEGTRQLGVSRQEILGHSIREFLVEDSGGVDLPQALRRASAGVAPPRAHLVQCRTSAGLRWHESVVSLHYDAEGRVVGVQGANRDVTERVLAERQLRESEERFRSLFGHAPIGMAVLDTDARVVQVNRAACEMFGYDGAALMELGVDAITHPDDIERTRQWRLGALVGQQTVLEQRFIHRSGRVIWASLSASVVRDEQGNVVHVVSQIQDITERRAAEEALQESLTELRRSEERLRQLARRQTAIREEERKRLGLGLHDDVCQELVGIAILLESVRQHPEPDAAGPERLQRAIHYVGEVGEHLRSLARELRPLQLQDLGLEGTLRSLAQGMSSDTKHIHVTFPTSVPRLDEDTELAFYRVAQEALANAVRHADARRIEVMLAAVDGRLRLEVSDDGCGFEPGSNPTGALGLASMEERALALGGRLAIWSAPGRGTTIRLDCALGDSRRVSAA